MVFYDHGTLFLGLFWGSYTGSRFGASGLGLGFIGFRVWGSEFGVHLDPPTTL